MEAQNTITIAGINALRIQGESENKTEVTVGKRKGQTFTASVLMTDRMPVLQIEGPKILINAQIMEIDIASKRWRSMLGTISIHEGIATVVDRTTAKELALAATA